MCAATNAPSSTDSARTNSTVGLHAGYFIIPMLSLGGELRYQRWLTTPTPLSMGNKVNFTDAAMDTVTVAIGPRAHFQVAKGMFLRPGISYARGARQAACPTRRTTWCRSTSRSISEGADGDDDQGSPTKPRAAVPISPR